MVIGRLCKDVPLERVCRGGPRLHLRQRRHRARLQKSDGQWARAKSFDTFCPLGPCLVTDSTRPTCSSPRRLNGEIVQDGRTTDMIFDIPALVAYVSHAFTLLPGDVILTGTPAGVGPIAKGDRVDIEIEGIGRAQVTRGECFCFKKKKKKKKKKNLAAP